MRGLVEIKRRIKSVLSTQKITKAMELVSTAKLKKWRDIYFESKVYSDELRKTIDRINRYTANRHFSFLINKDVDKKLYVVFSSSIGLCGGYNNNILKYASNIIDKDKDLVFVVGAKAESYFKERGYNVISALNSSIDDESSLFLTKQIVAYYFDKKVSEIIILYTNYINPVLYEPSTYRLLPLQEQINTENTLHFDADKELNELIYYPSAEKVIEYLVPNYLESMVKVLAIDAQVCEHAARRNAMENASDNADEINSTLQIIYNKLRQGAITQELTEIVAGANAS